MSTIEQDDTKSRVHTRARELAANEVEPSYFSVKRVYEALQREAFDSGYHWLGAKFMQRAAKQAVLNACKQYNEEFVQAIQMIKPLIGKEYKNIKVINARPRRTRYSSGWGWKVYLLVAIGKQQVTIAYDLPLGDNSGRHTGMTEDQRLARICADANTALMENPGPSAEDWYQII